MVKRVLLAFTFVVAGLVSAAKHGWERLQQRVGYAYPTTYAVGYAGYAPSPYVVGYAPRVAYYPPVPVRSYPWSTVA